MINQHVEQYRKLHPTFNINTLKSDLGGLCSSIHVHHFDENTILGSVPGRSPRASLERDPGVFNLTAVQLKTNIATGVLSIVIRRRHCRSYYY
jgi:hypothetical protein